jgi:hypothetical protein
MSNTTSGFKKTSIQGDLINDPDAGLYGEMDKLS